MSTPKEGPEPRRLPLLSHSRLTWFFEHIVTQDIIKTCHRTKIEPGCVSVPSRGASQDRVFRCKRSQNGFSPAYWLPRLRTQGSCRIFNVLCSIVGSTFYFSEMFRQPIGFLDYGRKVHVVSLMFCVRLFYLKALRHED